MGKQKGLVLLTGHLGGIIFYQSGGQYLTRAWDGHSKERIKTDPAFARVRENNMEFGGAATTAKSFKLAFSPVMRLMGDRYLTARLTQTFKKMCLQGSGDRGQRSISPRAHPKLLTGFEFHAQQPLGAVLDAPFDLSVSPARNAVTLTLPGVYLRPPEGASHFELLLAVGSLTEHVYTAAVKGYLPSDSTLNALVAFTAGDLLPLGDDGSTGPIVLTAAFAGAPALPADVAVVVALGVRFYQPVNGVPYPLVQGHAMKLVAVV